MTGCKYGPVIRHTPPTILFPVNSLDQIHCAIFSKRPGLNTGRTMKPDFDRVESQAVLLSTGTYARDMVASVVM
jgi:hypothetical protein